MTEGFSFYIRSVFPVLLTLIIISLFITALLIMLLKPLLIRYALARPNARSSHTIPTPQGGGIAILLTSMFLMLSYSLLGYPISKMLLILGWSLPLAFMGGMDDIRPLPPVFRLVIQVLICAGLVFFATLDANGIFTDFIPFWMEYGLLVLTLVWFVNLFNFMDGLDWICVCEAVPLLAALCFFFIMSGTMPEAFLAASLLGGFLAFAFFNKPIARLFLGDAGSLPLGLLIGYLLLELADQGAFVSALLLPLYYLCDATITLLKRFIQKKHVFQAHREHYYQQATDNGYSVLFIDGVVFSLNLALVLLAVIAYFYSSVMIQFICLCLGLVCVFSVMRLFSLTKRTRET